MAIIITFDSICAYINSLSFRKIRKYKTKRKVKLSHFRCGVFPFESHDHYIISNPNARCKTHDYRYSLYKWASGYKFFEWIIKPFKLIFNASRTFDKTRFVLKQNYNFRLGHLKQ